MLLPEVDATNEAFWTGGRDGSLLIARCASCRTWVHPPVPFCAACGGRDVVPEPVSGRGRVYTFTLNHMPWMTDDAWQRVLALVDLDEQEHLRVVTNIVDCDPTDVRSGMPVEVTFRQVDDVFLPVFRPA